MKAIMTGVALAALISGSPVLAAGKLQQVAQTDQQPAAQSETQNATACPQGQTCAPATTGSIPAQPGSNTAATATADTTQLTAKPGEKFFTEQDDNAVLASELIGKTVYHSADKSLGDINDIVWTKDGNIQGVIVGVGGFLGIGEKNVAVNFDALKITADENGDKKFVLDATKDELAAAPEFVTTAQKLAEIRAQQPPVPDQSGGLAPMQPAAPTQPAAPAQ